MLTWKSGTSTFLTLSLLAGVATPILTPATASAQLFPGQRQQRNRPTYSTQVIIPAGTEIPVEYDEAEKILVTEEETMPLTVTVASNIRNNRNQILVPYGSQLVGQLEPVGGGSQFVARELILPEGSRLPIIASSQVVTRREEVNSGTDVGSILQGAAIGAAATTVISLITGDRSAGLGEIFGGAGLGALGGWLLGGNDDSTQLISIDPSRDLDVTLNSDLSVTARRTNF
ncbi:MAG: hypothetical protein SW833_07445 [Cyanobacteriota bacterium]|nr:hypothetical protein [Cyanobacteriota bacterium]